MRLSTSRRSPPACVPSRVEPPATCAAGKRQCSVPLACCDKDWQSTMPEMEEGTRISLRERNTPVDKRELPDALNASFTPSTEPSNLSIVSSAALTSMPGETGEPEEGQRLTTVSDSHKGRTLQKELRWYDGFVLALAFPIYLF